MDNNTIICSGGEVNKSQTIEKFDFSNGDLETLLNKSLIGNVILKSKMKLSVTLRKSLVEEIAKEMLNTYKSEV